MRAKYRLASEAAAAGPDPAAGALDPAAECLHPVSTGEPGRTADADTPPGPVPESAVRHEKSLGGQASSKRVPAIGLLGSARLAGDGSDAAAAVACVPEARPAELETPPDRADGAGMVTPVCRAVEGEEMAMPAGTGADVSPQDGWNDAWDGGHAHGSVWVNVLPRGAEGSAAQGAAEGSLTGKSRDAHMSCPAAGEFLMGAVALDPLEAVASAKSEGACIADCAARGGLVGAPAPGSPGVENMRLGSGLGGQAAAAAGTPLLPAAHWRRLDDLLRESGFAGLAPAPPVRAAQHEPYPKACNPYIRKDTVTSSMLGL